MTMSPARQAVCVWAALSLASLAYLALARGGGRGPPPAAPVRMDGWGVQDLAGALSRRGLKLRLVPTALGPAASRSAVLTATDKGWGDFNSLTKSADCVHLWEGSVYCERLGQPGSRDLQVRLWGDCCLEAGPFL